MDPKQFEVLTRKIDSIAKLLALNIVRDKTVTEQIDTLSKAGFRPIEIADLLGKTENQINVTLSNLRKSAKKKEPLSEQETEQGGSDTNG